MKGDTVYVVESYTCWNDGGGTLDIYTDEQVARKAVGALKRTLGKKYPGEKWVAYHMRASKCRAYPDHHGWSLHDGERGVALTPKVLK
jgi:hypothetical protein